MAIVKLLKKDGGNLKQTRSTDDIVLNSYQIGATGNKLVDNSGITELKLNDDSDLATLKVKSLLIDNNAITEIERESIVVESNFITLNANETGTPSEDAYIAVERGTSANAEVRWKESTDRFQAGTVGALKDIVLTDTTDTLTNKTIDCASNTVTNVGASEVEKGIILDQSSATIALGDSVLFSDVDDSGNLKQGTVQDIIDLVGSAGESNTASNVGTGAGVFKQKTGVDLEFKSLKSSDSSVTITGDTNEIDLVVASAPSATYAGQTRTTYTAGTGGIAQYNPVYVSANNTVLKASASGIATAKVIGLAPAAISATASGAIVTKGLLTGVGSGWTAGAPVYLSTTAGATTQTAPSADDEVVIQLGVAKNATDLEIEIGTLIIN